MRQLFVIILGVFLLAQPAAISSADETLLAVRKAYFKSTGLQWEDASEDIQKKFLEKFKRQEEMLSIKERLRIARGERAEMRKQRSKENDKRKLERMEHDRERKKMAELREFERQKQIRKAKFERVKQKLIRARQKSNAQR